MSCTCVPASDRLTPVAISPKLLTDGESVVVDTRTHPKAIAAPLLLLVVVLFAAVWLDQQVDVKYTGWVIWGLAAVVLVIWVVKPLLEWLTATYTITNKRLITREGLIARRGHDIPLLRISDVAYDMGVVDRMFGCGTLVVSDASTHGTVKLHDIPRVEEVQHQLSELLGGSHATQTRDDDGT
jgi:membrane protein YdbS with pleckstrin-like domain